jgi:hypothetical protein
MEKTDFSAVLKQPAKGHLTYFVKGPLDLSKQRTELAPPKQIALAVSPQSSVVNAGGQVAAPVATELTRVLYVELGYVETAEDVIHIHIFQGIAGG